MEGEGENQKSLEFQPPANALDITPNKDRGIWKEIVKDGEGYETPGPGSKVSVHYVGTLLDGTKFDSSRDRGEPFEFNLGKGNVIKAWDIGVATMKKGEIAVLTCKSEYAYGLQGSPPKIPPNATLVFEVEVLGWQGEDLSQKKDGGIIRHMIKKGEGYTSPNDGALVEVRLIGTYNGCEFENRELSFNLGEGGEHEICEGVERALEKFKQGERSRIVLKSQYAFKEAGKPEYQIPPYADVEYDIELIRFEKAKECWSLDSEEKLEEAKLLKDKGSYYFKAGKYKLALKFYKKMNTFLESNTGFEDDKDVDRKALLVVGHLNLAMTLLKLEEFVEARDACNSALELQPNNLKGLFRRGQANLSLGEPDKALEDFEMVLKLEPTNKAAANQVLICRKGVKEQRCKEKQIYANMFEKFAQRDREEQNDLLCGWWDDGKVLVQEEKIELLKKQKPKFEPCKTLAKEKVDSSKTLELEKNHTHSGQENNESRVEDVNHHC